VVADAMTMEYQTVPLDMPVPELTKLLHDQHIRSCPVLDPNNSLVGIVTEYDVKKVALGSEAESRTVSEIMTTNLVTCTPDESLRAALHRFTGKDFHQILVVARNSPEKLLGALRRGEILFAYNELAEEHQRLLSKNSLDLPIAYRDSLQLNVRILAGQSGICFKKIKDIKFPSQYLIVVIYRGDRMVIPRGDTVIEPGDVMVLHTTRSQERKVRDWIERL